jgi:hypothetical protein
VDDRCFVEAIDAGKGRLVGEEQASWLSTWQEFQRVSTKGRHGQPPAKLNLANSMAYVNFGAGLERAKGIEPSTISLGS